MPTPIRTLTLRLTPPPDDSADVRDLLAGLSAVVQVGPYLWAACDETATLERLTDQGDGVYADHRTYPLADLLDLPGDEDDEVDVEGVAWAPPYLWLVGSYSRARRKPGDGSAKERIARLAKTTDSDNRYLLARIPLAVVEGTDELVPCRRCPSLHDPDAELTAARLRGEGRDNALLEALDGDRHLRRFLKIPGKDNGFDVEGLAAVGERLFLGLRGPVLRGWAVVLEVEARDDGDGTLRLRRIGPGKRRYRKHFLDLEGLGVRELAEDGDDLLVLAGPTMDVRAPAALFRWKGALRADEEQLVEGDAIEKLMELPHDVEGGHDHPEGVCLFAAPDLPPAVLVAYDAASSHRRSGNGVQVDVFELPG
jgi:Protein of unknown function (DUF3616)